MKWFTYLLCLSVCISLSNCILFEDEYPTLKPYNYDLSKDTTVQHYLENLHGVWIRKGYLKTLRENKSLYFTNKIYENSFVMLHIDKNQFHQYYLPIIAKTPQDAIPKKTFLYFEQREDGIMLSLMTNHAIYKAAKTPFIAYLSEGNTDFELVIQADKERLKMLENRYERWTTELPPRNEIERPFVAIESFIKENLVSGTYNVLNTDYEVIESDFELGRTGSLAIEPYENLTRYTFWSTPEADHLRFNLIGGMEHHFFGAKDYVVQFNQGDLILYESVKIPNRRNQYRLEKRWILQRN